jgi:hypothetical protein
VFNTTVLSLVQRVPKQPPESISEHKYPSDTLQLCIAEHPIYFIHISQLHIIKFLTLVLKVVPSLLAAVTVIFLSSIDGGVSYRSALWALTFISSDSTIQASFFFNEAVGLSRRCCFQLHVSVGGQQLTISVQSRICIHIDMFQVTFITHVIL